MTKRKTVHNTAKLTPTQVRYIRANCKRRGAQMKLAKKFKVTQPNISRIVH